MKRSEKNFPLSDLDVFDYLKKMWEEGWLDEYAEKHFLIRMLKGDDKLLRSTFNQHKCTYDGNYCASHETYLMNLNFRFVEFSTMFGEENIKKFVKDQLSAGKKHYRQETYFQAMAELDIIHYFLSFGTTYEKTCEYEPSANNSKCNPEARITYLDGTVINIEVKTPSFTDKLNRADRYMPLVLLDEVGRNKFEAKCKEYGACSIMPRVMKLKEFLNSAATKFEKIRDEKTFNILFINWTYTEITPNGYYEACSLLCNDMNGIMKYPEIGISLGITEDVYEKVSAILVYQCPDEMMVFHDFRYIFAERRAAFLINPLIIDTNDKYSSILNLMNFKENDFVWKEKLIVNYNVEQNHFNTKIINDLGKIVLENALKISKI